VLEESCRDVRGAHELHDATETAPFGSIGLVWNRAHAMHIIRCVNSHAALVNALAFVVEEIDSTYDASCEPGGLWQGGASLTTTTCEIARAALAEVKL